MIEEFKALAESFTKEGDEAAKKAKETMSVELYSKASTLYGCSTKIWELINKIDNK